MRSRMPKLLHPVCGRPMIGWPLAAARAAGAEAIVVVDGPAQSLQPHLGDGVTTVIQSEPRGTGDAVRAAAEHFRAGQTVVVLNGDVPLIAAQTIRELVAARERSAAAAAVLTAELSDPTGYGRVVRSGPSGDVVKIVETKRPGDATEEEMAIREVNAGIYAFDGALLGGALQRIGADNAQGEYYLPDALTVLRAEGGRIAAHRLSDADEILGVNDRRQLSEVRQVAQRRIIEAHMLAGATIVDPGATVIDVGVELGEDVTVAPFTSLHGSTRIGRGSTVGPHATLIDAAIGEEASVVHAYVQAARIEDRVSVGPFAYLRPGTVMRTGSRAGTFVEIKNSDVGAGSKVPHLSYIGDADIGEGTNLGAATITANYDGYRKHRTTIGANVRGGVDVTLVAPVEIGDDAYTGAGSVITKNVPEGSLAIARARQNNLAGYAQKRRERAESDANQRD